MPDESFVTTESALLARYLSGNCTLAECARVEAWAAESPANAAEMAALRTTWAAGSNAGASAPWNLEALWQHVAPPDNHRVLELIPRQPTSSSAKGWAQHGVVRSVIAGLAAAIVVGIIVELPTRAGRGQLTHTYLTRPGQRETVTLVDGTQCTLAPDSRLTIPAAFGRSTREVALEGAGVFSVVHNTRYPFAVHANGVVARDVGTRFGVQAYAQDSVVRVAVTEGEIALPSAAVHAGEVAVVARDGRTRVTHNDSAATEVAWADGWLVFREVPLREIARQLSRWYGQDIQIGDSAVAARRVTASFHDAPLSKVLDAIVLLADARYEQHQSTVTIFSSRIR